MVEHYKEELAVIKNINIELEKQADIFFDEDLFQTAKEKKEIDKEDLMRKGELRNAYTFLANEIDKLKGNEDELAFASENLGEIFKENELAFAQMGITTLPQLEVAMSKIKDTSKDVGTTFADALAPAIQSMSLSFTNDFVNALLEGQNALQSFKDFSKNIVSQIISTFLQMAVVNEILNSVFGLTGTSDALPTLRKSAGGGSAYGGEPMLVGERG